MKADIGIDNAEILHIMEILTKYDNYKPGLHAVKTVDAATGQKGKRRRSEGKNMNNREFGKLGEDMAAGYLEKQGCKILHRNFRSREGEIDIVAEKDGVLRVVEVKTRRPGLFGSPAEAVDRRKRAHIRQAARVYLAECGRYYRSVDMDVIEIVLNHIKGAF